MDERALLELLDRDPNAAMEALLERCGPLLRYVVGGVLRDPQDAEDCYSAVTELLWRRLGEYDPDRGSLTAWLTALARNTALNHLKAKLRRQRHPAEPEADAPAPDTPEDALLRREQAERLQTAIARLGETDRQIFYRRYYYLQPVAQIAAEMGMTERAAEGRLYRLRQRLRRELGGDAP